MPDPIPTPEAPRPPNIIIGETPVYLATPQKIGDAEITSFVINGKDQRTTEGIGSAVVLTREPSRKKGESGVMEEKPNLNIDRMDQKLWDDISGVRWYDEAGVSHDIPKEQLSLTPFEAPGQEAPAETPAAVPVVPEKPTQPPIAREVLETIKQDTNVITIVGLKAYETRALDLADRKMQKMVTPKAAEQAAATLDVFAKAKEGWQDLRDIGRTIWKQSIGGIYFHEKARQYYLGMLRAAETPFAEESIRLAEARATKWYNDKLADKNFLARARTRVVEWFKDTVGMQTAIQKKALDELASMKTAGEIQGQEVFVREAAAVRARFGQDMTKADAFVRENLGERLEILDPGKAEYQPIVTGIKDLFTRYANGDIKDKTAFDQESKAFFQKTLKDAAPKVFAEAELYSSSLFDAAETIRTKMSHEAGLSNIDEAMAGMEIRLAMGTMGEVTSVDPTAVQKGVEKVRNLYEQLNKKHILVPTIFNEATIGSGVAIALSAANFLKTAPARALGGVAGGALAGGLFAGWRQYGQLHKEYLTHLREREAGSTFAESMKRRAWFEKYMVKQRSAEEMMHTIRDSLYEADGTTLKTTLTDDEVRSALATVADTQARKAVSETGPKHIGLIQFTSREMIETERAALDLTATNALGDLENYLSAHTEQSQTILGGNNYGDFIQKLTVDQTRILRDGAKTLDSLDDPVKGVLGLVSSYAPEAEIIKRRWPFASRMSTADEKAMGVDAILEEFRKEARVEAIKYGIKAGAIGAGVGVAMRGVAELFAAAPHAAGVVAEKAKEAVAGAPAGTHDVIVGATHYEAPNNLIISGHTGGPEGRISLYDVKYETAQGAPLSLQNATEQQMKDALQKAGFIIDDGHKVGDLIPQIPGVTMHDQIIPGIKTPDGADLHLTLPRSYEIHYVPDHHNWQVIDTRTNMAITDLRFNEAGQLTGTPQEISLAHGALMQHGVTIDMKPDTIGPNHVTLPASPPIPQPPAESAAVTPLETFDVKGNELGKGGLWDYFLGKSRGENSMAETNVLKNLLRIYAHDHKEVITFPKGSPHEGYFDNPGHLRPATWGADHVKINEIDLNRIPNDAAIHLPKELFGPDALDKFAKLNDVAIHDYQELVKTGLTPMDALHKLAEGTDHQKAEALMLRLGYFGRDSDLPTNASDLTPLWKELGATHMMVQTPPVPGVPPISEAPTTPFTLHHLVMNPTYTDSVPAHIIPPNVEGMAGATARVIPQGTEMWPAGMDESARAALREQVATVSQERFPWFPIFIPLRAPLEAFPVEVVTEKPRAPESFLSPVGRDETYLSAEALDARRSPRLKEHTDAKLSQSEELAWHLAALTDEEKQMLESFKAQHEGGLAPETRTVVMIPTTLGGSSIYQSLSRYAGQVDKNGNPIDPKKATFVVFDYRTGSEPADNTKGEVDRFIAAHPDMPVIYLSHTYDTAPLAGKIKRDMSTFVFDQIASLPADHPDVALVTHANAAIPSTYLASIIDTLDQAPTRDVLYGTYHMPQEVYAEYPMLFASLRANEIFDALVRHGALAGMPAVYDGNIATRAAVAAAVGGYNPAAIGVEDRELLWMVSRARKNNPESIGPSPDLMATLDPKEITYATLQQLGLADRAVPLGNNAVYRDLPWQEMAQKASDAFTKDHLEQALSNLYATSYPALKKDKPELFDAYFQRTMHKLGLTYHITEGKVTITDDTALFANMAAAIDVESMAKDEAKAIKPPEKPREVLADIAQTTPNATQEMTEVPPEPTTTPSITSPDVT